MMDRGAFGDIYTWVLDEEIYGKMFRLRIRDGVSGSFSVHRHKVRLYQFIEMPDKDFLIGFKTYNESTGELGDNITYTRLSDMLLEYFPSDQKTDF